MGRGRSAWPRLYSQPQRWGLGGSLLERSQPGACLSPSHLTSPLCLLHIFLTCPCWPALLGSWAHFSVLKIPSHSTLALQEVLEAALVATCLSLTMNPLKPPGTVSSEVPQGWGGAGLPPGLPLTLLPHPAHSCLAPNNGNSNRENCPLHAVPGTALGSRDSGVSRDPLSAFRSSPAQEAGSSFTPTLQMGKLARVCKLPPAAGLSGEARAHWPRE